MTVLVVRFCYAYDKVYRPVDATSWAQAARHCVEAAKLACALRLDSEFCVRIVVDPDLRSRES
jgi:hypothetical protein